MILRVLKAYVMFGSACLGWPLAAASGLPEAILTNQSVSLLADQRVPRLTTAAQVHRLSRAEAASGQRVLIRGAVTCALPGFEAAVVQDATSGIYVDRWTPSTAGTPQVGELVEVDGITDPGQFAPRVHAVRITRFGTEELPPPVHPYWDQLINGSLDTQFVELEGIITAVRSARVTLLTHGGKINAMVFDASGGTNEAVLKSYEGALVRLRGCLFASWDPVTHEVNVSEIRMFAPSVTVIEGPPSDAFAVPPKRVADLFLFDAQASALRRVRVSGQVVQERQGEYFAMAGTNGFRFSPRDAVRLGTGDLVDVVGFPSLSGPSPVLQEALVRKTGTAPLPERPPAGRREPVPGRKRRHPRARHRCVGECECRSADA